MPLLEAVDIAKSFRGVDALDGVSIALEEGEAIGLVGPNGAGKSTLIDIVSGFTEPSRGEVRLRGEAITRDPPYRRVRRGLGRTFQIVEVFTGMTALESVMVAAHVLHRGRRGARSAATESLEFVGLGAERDRPVDELSLAQQRLLELARVLALRPSVMLLDEPMSGLTLNERRLATASVRDLHARGVGFVLVEHDMGVIGDLCDRVYVLDHGQLIATGTPDEIARDEAVIAAYLGVGTVPDEPVREVREP